MLDVHADALSLTVPGSLSPSLSFPPSPSLLPASPPPGFAGHSAVELVEQEMVRGVSLCCVARPAASTTGLAYSGMVPTACNPSTALPSAAPAASATHSEQATSVGSLAAAVVSGGAPALALSSSMTHSGFRGEPGSLPSAAWCREKEQRRVTPKRPAPPGSALAPRAKKKKEVMVPYKEFCRAQRPLLPTSLRNAERERILGQRWKALSEAERVAKWGSPAPVPAPTGAALGHYPAPGPPETPSQVPFPVQRPVHRVTPDRHVALVSAKQTAAPLADRWAGLWKAKDEAKEAKATAAGPAPGDLTLTAPPPPLAEPEFRVYAFAEPSGAPAAAAPAEAPPAAPSAPAAAQPHAPAAHRGMVGRCVVRPGPTFAPAAPPVEHLVLPNGTIIPCFPRMYMNMNARSTPAAPAPASAAPAAAAASKEEVPAAAAPSPSPGAPAPPPSSALPIHFPWLDPWLDQRLQDELEQLTVEEAIDAFFD